MDDEYRIPDWEDEPYCWSRMPIRENTKLNPENNKTRKDSL